jgi:iron complex outermembrane recepter protein
VAVGQPKLSPKHADLYQESNAGLVRDYKVRKSRSAIVARGQSVHITQKTVTTLLGIASLSGSCAVYAAAAGTPGTAPAEESSEPGNANSEGLEEIVVTAQKRAERLNDVPLSVTAATGSRLQELGVTSPAALEKFVPGFTFTQSAYSAPIYTIRGIGSYDEAIAISPAVGVYVDQVPLPFSRMTRGASLDLSRVEVLKGPQGTLFGQNSTGGAVNYVANRPTSEFKTGGQITYGRFDETDVEAYVSGPIATGLNARLAVRTEQRGDWQTSSSTGEQLGQRHFTNGRLLIDWQPRDTLRFELGLNGWFDKSDTQAKQKIGYAPIAPGGYQGAIGFPDLQSQLRAYPNAGNDPRAADWNPEQNLKRNDNFYQVLLHADWDLSERIALTSIGAYSHLQVDTPNDNDATIYPNSYSTILGSIDSYTEEIRASGAVGEADRLKWMLGGNYEYDGPHDKQHLSINATNSGIATFRWNGLDNINNQVINTRAVFGSLDLGLTQTLGWQGSVRYTSQEHGYHGCLADNGNGQLAAAFSFLSTNLSRSATLIPPGGCVTLDPVTNKPLTNGIRSSLDQNNVSWRSGFSWKPLPDWLLYANATKGFKAGSYGTVPAIRPVQAEPVTQESVLAYESGFKVELFDHAAQVSGAAFYYDYKHKQLLGSVNLGAPFGTLPGMVSIPHSRVSGGELDTTVEPFKGLTLRVGGTYVSSKVLGSYLLANPLGGPSVDIGGDRFPNTPLVQATGDAQYRYTLSDDWSVFVGANATYRTSTLSFFAGNQLFKLPAYALLDARTGFEYRAWRVELWGHNLADRFYTTFASRVTDTVIRTVGMPLTYGITVTATLE